MAPRQIQVTDVLGVRGDQPRSRLIPLQGKLLEPDRYSKEGEARVFRCNNPDSNAAMALFRIGRMLNEDFPRLGDYISKLMGIFEYSRLCSVYLLPRVATGSVGSLEHRVSVVRDDKIFMVYGSGEHGFIQEGSRMAELRDQVFASRSPTFIDYDGRLALIFDDLNIDNMGCTVHALNETTGNGMREGSLAFVPFYYRDPSYPSGIVLFEGDLRYKKSELTGFDSAFWSALATVEAASQLAFMITHRFDAITTLMKLVDFNADLLCVIRQTINRRMKNSYVILIDVDDFKQINDEHSYQCGNVALRRVADKVKESIRPEDVIARWGGDEFAGLIKVVTKEKALEIAERIRKNVEASTQDGIRVTCSIGVANVDEIVTKNLAGLRPNDITDSTIEGIFESVFHNANTAVKSAKQNGRNRVYFIEDGVVRSITPVL